MTQPQTEQWQYCIHLIAHPFPPQKMRHIASSQLTTAKKKFGDKEWNSYTLHLKLEPFRAPRRQTKAECGGMAKCPQVANMPERTPIIIIKGTTLINGCFSKL